MNVEKEFICNYKEIPFKVSLSLIPLIEELREISTNKNHPYCLNASDVLERVNNIPELLADSIKPELLRKHAQIIQQLMSFVIIPNSDDFGPEAIYTPFENNPIFANSSYHEKISNDNLELEFATKFTKDQEKLAIIFQAFLVVLKTYYNFDFSTDVPFTFKVYNKNTGEERFYIKHFNLKHLKVKTKNKIQPLSKDDIHELFDNATDFTVWNEKIPLKDFEFSGFIHSRYINVTHDYVMSELKSDLIDKDTILSNKGFDKITDKVRVLIDNPQLFFGISARPNLQANSKKNNLWRNTILKADFDKHKLQGSIYDKAIKTEKIQLVSDYKNIQDEHPVNKQFVELGIRTHAVVPLLLDDEVIGMMEFACQSPKTLSMFQIMRLHEVFPIFALALKRSREEWDDTLQAIIQNNFTAIHPTVLWRFREVAAQMLRAKQADGAATSEPIIFQDVLPLYGASDIKGSSLERNKAIQSDLQEQLQMAESVLVQFGKYKTIPIVNDLIFKIEQNIKLVESGLNSGDEVSIVEFMKTEISPILDILKVRIKDMQEPIKAYTDILDPELGILYKKRKDFEDSVTLINDTVSEIIDTEQAKSQEVFPHYFEKYRTDGIEYNAYIGQSLVQDIDYNNIYLSNLRLWQLLVKVKVARSIRQLQPKLKTKLDITQLILLHSNPLSIEFRQDEKKFDVAGTYNIRYEITKKRIDKALIKGSNERITQVGKIAIIYSHSSEINEYQKFIDYLISQGFITDNIEYLDLEDLKGAAGLHALRIEVNFNCSKSAEIEGFDLLQTGI
ncbi:GAF domain-containing protein [Saccharicrinis aurantiacus]|uniref:GAF domain-containing protein n=1 Tax=Saccharicrinis aurantiacus TaxID=1849719 RepID=UPI00248F95BE|nr:GAF domain-containing protein [Saccharicrinis aurantiacus]